MVSTMNITKIRYAIENRKALTLTTIAYRSDERRYIDTILDMYLQEAGREDLKNQLSYCLHELAGNAKKANTKRIYFFDRQLDIQNSAEYYIGMDNFKDETIDNIDYYIEKIREHGLYIKFQFYLTDKHLKISVRNNCEMNRIEAERVQRKIRAADRYADMAEAYTNIEDNSEGAGLGLVMMLIMLRSLGLGVDCLSISCRDGETIARLKIPICDTRELFIQN
jgi:hypothetical protein